MIIFKRKVENEKFEMKKKSLWMGKNEKFRLIIILEVGLERNFFDSSHAYKSVTLKPIIGGLVKLLINPMNVLT